MENLLTIRVQKNVHYVKANQENLKKYSKCRSVWYCIREHQREDWNRHKVINNKCKFFLNQREFKKNCFRRIKKEFFDVYMGDELNGSIEA